MSEEQETPDQVAASNQDIKASDAQTDAVPAFYKDDATLGPVDAPPERESESEEQETPGVGGASSTDGEREETEADANLTPLKEHVGAVTGLDSAPPEHHRRRLTSRSDQVVPLQDQAVKWIYSIHTTIAKLQQKHWWEPLSLRLIAVLETINRVKRGAPEHLLKLRPDHPARQLDNLLSQVRESIGIRQRPSDPHSVDMWAFQTPETQDEIVEQLNKFSRRYQPDLPPSDILDPLNKPVVIDTALASIAGNLRRVVTGVTKSNNGGREVMDTKGGDAETAPPPEQPTATEE